MQISLEEAAYIAQLIGVVAVIVSLVYLAMQLRQNNKMIRLGTLHDVTSLYISCMLAVSHDQESMDLWVKGLEGPEDLSSGERARYIALMGASMRTLAELDFQWQQGALDSDTWNGLKGVLDDFAQYTGFTWYWELRRHVFSESFRNYVEDAIARAPVAARPLYK